MQLHLERFDLLAMRLKKFTKLTGLLIAPIVKLENFGDEGGGGCHEVMMYIRRVIVVKRQIRQNAFARLIYAPQPLLF